MAAATAQNGMTLALSSRHGLPLIDSGVATDAPHTPSGRTMELYDRKTGRQAAARDVRMVQGGRAAFPPRHPRATA